MSTRMFIRLLSPLILFYQLFCSPVFAEVQKDSPTTATNDKSPALSQVELNAQQELEALKAKPQEYRILILGVQIFLGRFGYGTGPYTGTMDDLTGTALRTYQKYVNLPVTGDIDIRTLQSLTQDNLALDQPVPFLPQATFQFTEWDTTIQAQGTWVRQDSPTTDSIHTSKISCYRAQNHCVESTAILLKHTVPILEVLTNIYSVKEWTENTLVTSSYSGEPCTTSIVRFNRKEQTILRFTAYQEGEGLCAKVQTEDVQYRLVNGQKVYAQLKQQKAEATKRILRVQE